MDAPALLERLGELGVNISVDDRCLLLTPASRIPPEVRQVVIENKPSLLRHMQALRSARLLVADVCRWAGGDADRWRRVLNGIKRGWDLSLGIDSPRDVLIRWASCHCRFGEAAAETTRLPRRQRQTAVSRRAIEGRKADLSFFGRHAEALDSRVPSALSQDPVAADILRQLTADHTESGHVVKSQGLADLSGRDR